jgi:hypothetical protein
MNGPCDLIGGENTWPAELVLGFWWSTGGMMRCWLEPVIPAGAAPPSDGLTRQPGVRLTIKLESTLPCAD